MKLSLAPMQDVTDLAFMRVLAQIGSLPDYFITAYFRSTPTTCAFVEQNVRCLTENETGVPIWAQIAGNDPAAIVRDMKMLQQYPIAGINLNAGCPSALVNRNHAGAGLLRELPLLRRITHAMREHAPLGQFSIKCRLGWSDAESEFPAIIEELRLAQPDEILIHARTRQQLYRGEAQRSYVTQAVEAVKSWVSPCPVIGNGDILSAADAQLWMNETGAAGVMIGRGAVRNPYLFREIRGGAKASDGEMRRYYGLLIEETGRILHHYTERGHCNRVKKYLNYIYPNLNSAECEHRLRRCTSLREMMELLGC